MKPEEIREMDNDLIAKRVRIFLKKPDDYMNSIEIKGNSRKVISPLIVELTYHGYMEEDNSIGDDNYSYNLNDIEKIEVVGDATYQEMGCIEVINTKVNDG